MAVDLDEVRRFVRCLIDEDSDFHFSLLGMKVLGVERAWASLTMPYNTNIIGDPETGVIHGGPITALLDTCSGFAATTVLDDLGMTPTIDLRIDYMGSAIPEQAVIAEAEVYRSTDNIIFTRALAHQGDKEKPVACAVGTFFRMPTAAFDDLRQAFRSGAMQAIRGEAGK